MFKRKIEEANDGMQEFSNIPIFQLSNHQTEQRDVERAFARLFSSDDGRRVLSHLQAMTFCRALGPSAPDEQLRYAEGQRALMANILRLIDRGRSP